MIIAVDGPAASGKGTIAKKMAEVLGISHLDTGAMFRSVAFLMIQDNADLQNSDLVTQYAQTLSPEVFQSLCENEEIRADEIGKGASIIAVFPTVRKVLLDFQREFPYKNGNNGAILDGRDIGTVVFPNADYKFYITASTEARAKRRLIDLQVKKPDISYETVFSDMLVRDERDMNRKEAPMQIANDAIVIDTSDMTPDEVLKEALRHIKR